MTSALPALVLSIDPGQTSGWAVAWNGRVTVAGSARTASVRAGIVTAAVRDASDAGLPLIVVREDWSVGGIRMTPATMLGLGAQWGRWAEHLDLHDVPAKNVVRVKPQRWRSALAGLPRRSRAEAKASACLVARGLLSRDVEEDEGEAVVIAHWALHAIEVAEVAAAARARLERKRRVA